MAAVLLRTEAEIELSWNTYGSMYEYVEAIELYVRTYVRTFVVSS